MQQNHSPACYRRAIALLTTAYSDEDSLFFNLLLAECGFDDVRVLVDLALQGIEHIAEFEGSTTTHKLGSIQRAVDEVIAEQTEFHTT